MAEKSSNGLLKVGVIGSAIAAICCFTPVLTITLGVIGLGVFTGYLDYILLPALAVFIGIMIYAVARRGRGTCDESCPPGRGSSK
ncbi:MAG: mercury resistance system transport protein MerF [Nitrospiria bacterium]